MKHFFVNIFVHDNSSAPSPTPTGRTTFTIPPDLNDDWELSKGPKGGPPLPRKADDKGRKKYQYGIHAAVRKAGMTPQEFKDLFRWMTLCVDAKKWMGELRNAGIGNKNRGKDVAKLNNCVNLLRKEWVPFYNIHNKDHEIKLNKSAPLTRDAAKISKSYSDAKTNVKKIPASSPHYS